MTHDLKTSLDELAEAEFADAPVSTIDIGRARADGRRRVLASRLAPIGGGMAVIAATALVVNGLGGTSPAKAGAQNTSTAAGRDFSGTDPLTATATFGWLPDGYVTATHTSGADYGAGVVARTKEALSSTPVTPSMLSLTASATEPQLRGGETKTPVTVAGSQQAYLVTNPADAAGIPSDLSLQWQTVSSSWLTLGGYNAVHGSDLRALLIKVANAVTADDAAVPLPIHIEGLPKDVTLGSAMLNDPLTVGSDGFTVGLSYHSGTAGPGTGHYFSISVAPTGYQDPSQAKGSHSDPNSLAVPKITAYPVTPTPDTCKDSKGLHICVQDDPKQPGPDPLASVGGAEGLLDRITSLGTDPANWTTHVVN